MSLTGKIVSDSQTGFRAMKKDVFEKLNLQSDGFDIEAEITIKSLLNGFTFKEIPITIEKRRYNLSKIKVFSDGRKILTTIIRSSLSNVE
jgi:dolichol-phosphate mannosyltransferase